MRPIPVLSFPVSSGLLAVWALSAASCRAPTEITVDLPRRFTSAPPAMPPITRSRAPGSSPIVNLRIGNRTNDPEDSGGYLAPWTGPLATASTLFFDCGQGINQYPNIYWACDNQTGFHLLGSGSTWVYNTPNVPLEVYLR